MALPLRIAYDFAIRAVEAASRYDFSRIYLSIVAGLTFVSEVIRVQADLGIVAVDIIQPRLVMDNQPGLYVANLAQTAVDGQSPTDVGIPCPFPGSGLVKLFLVHA